MAKVDLHTHSNCSDGSDSPIELAKKVVASGVKIFALTDHDTTEGCKLVVQNLPSNITFIPSVELTCIAGDIKCHILGYNCDYNNAELINLIQKGKLLRRKKLETRIKYLKDKWDIILNKDELQWLYSRNSVVKTHIANILVNRGLASDNVSAMKKYLDGCKAGDSRFTIVEAINAIEASGGIPVWAHPLGGEGETHESFEMFESKLVKMIGYGVKGLECYYSRYDNREISYLVNCAKRKDLYISGGSDYHGSNKIGIELAKLNIDSEYIDSNRLSILNIIY